MMLLIMMDEQFCVMSPSNSPCAACKIQRRKCTQDCVFAPYFPPDNPQRFSYVHQVFGASNVAKILGDINPAQREDAVKSLAYEAEARLRDPVYGCVGVISVLQHTLKLLQAQLLTAKKELATYVGVGVGPPPMHGIPPNAPQLIMPDQLFQAQSQAQAQAQAQQFAMAATRDQDDMMHQDILRLNHVIKRGRQNGYFQEIRNTRR
ncbi:LOB domain-containing protein 36-like [Senna tora]|uniref:LOB domain-containing protein 36-like n=1 Tax=Senna tora TaxID=362788 RepID=A0A834TWJ8_9FABA|nr:LOB domain-containing protein 36-like [Senna tora]